MTAERDPVEQAQAIRQWASAGIERADELVRQVDELTERIRAHRRSTHGATEAGRLSPGRRPPSRRPSDSSPDS